MLGSENGKNPWLLACLSPHSAVIMGFLPTKSCERLRQHPTSFPSHPMQVCVASGAGIVESKPQKARPFPATASFEATVNSVGRSHWLDAFR